MEHNYSRLYGAVRRLSGSAIAVAGMLAGAGCASSGTSASGTYSVEPDDRAQRRVVGRRTLRRSHQRRLERTQALSEGRRRGRPGLFHRRRPRRDADAGGQLLGAPHRVESSVDAAERGVGSGRGTAVAGRAGQSDEGREDLFQRTGLLHPRHGQHGVPRRSGIARVSPHGAERRGESRAVSDGSRRRVAGRGVVPARRELERDARR